MRENGTLYWLLKHQLCSTAVVVDASGTVTGERKYLAYGDTRDISGTVPILAKPSSGWRNTAWQPVRRQ